MAPAPAAPVLRVGHSILSPERPLSGLRARLAGQAWDMVELDVLARSDGELVVAHDPGVLARPGQLGFADALRELTAAVGPAMRFDVDVKATGYERAVAAAIDGAGIADRTLVSTMHLTSLRALRDCAPGLTLGLSVPLARRDYLASRLTRPGAFAMLAYLRRALPARVARTLAAGEADAIMAHWGVVTPRLIAAVRDHGAELFAWTVDDPRRLRALLPLGVTGVITNTWEVFERAEV